MLRYFVPIMAVLCSLFYGCKGPPTTGDRTVQHPDGKACTERPPASYNASAESRLKATLPLAGKTEAQAEASIQAYLRQEAGGTKKGEDVGDILNHICQMASNGNWSEAGTQRLVEMTIAGWAGKETEDKKGTAGAGPTPKESPAIRLAKSCKQPIVGLNRRPEAFLPIWIELLLRLRDDKFPPDRDLQNLYNIKSRRRDSYNAPEDFFSESLYTLKCLEDVGELKLESLGTTGTYGGKVFENQRIVFRDP
jgi:hypothetical protein